MNLWSRQKDTFKTYFDNELLAMAVKCVGFAIWGDVCTYGILYSVGRLLDQATDRAAYKTPKVQKINEITPDCEVYSCQAK